MITQRASLLGFVGFCFYLIAIVNSLPTFYYVLTWLSVGLLVSTFGIALLSLVGLECRWQITRARASELAGGDSTDSSALVKLYLANGGSLNKTGVGVEFRLRSLATGAIFTQRFLIEALPSGTSLESSLALCGLGRGRYKIEEVRLMGSDVLGLFRIQRRLQPPADEVSEEIIVGPAAIPPPQGFLWRHIFAGHQTGDIEARHRLGQGEELRGTRAYVPGDDLRQVHWKTTARAGELVVKEFHHRGHSRAIVAWDGPLGTDWADGEATEWGLRLGVSLCRALAENGAPCAFARLDDRPTLVEPQGSRTAFLPALVDAMADARAERETSLMDCIGVLRGGADEIFLITASLSHEVPEFSALWVGRGARVTVAIVDGASLGAASRDRRFRPRYLRRGRIPVQTVPVRSGADGEKVRSLPVTPEAYAAQLSAVRKTGAHAVLIQPGEAGAEEFTLPLRQGLVNLFQRNGIPKVLTSVGLRAS